MRKILIVLISSFLILSFTKYRYGGELSIYLPEPISLNPYESSFSDLPLFSLLWTNIFERIDGKIISAVFESWEWEKEKKTWKFFLRKGLLFSNGSSVSSSDVKRSLELYLRSGQPGSKTLSKIISGGEEFLLGRTSKVSGITAQGQEELVITLKTAGEDFLNLLSSPFIFLYTGSENIFSGPFILSSWKKGDSMILKPNPYFGMGRVFLDRMKILFKGDAPNLDFSVEGIKIHQPVREYEVKKPIFIFFNSRALNQNTRVSLFLMLKNKMVKNEIFEPSNSFVETGFSIPLPQSSGLQSLVLPELKLNIAVERGLEPLASFLEKIFKDIKVESEFVFIPSFQIKEVFESPYFQGVIFFAPPSPFYSKEKELIHYIEEYNITKYDENLIAIVNLLSELEKISEEDKKMESLFYIQKNMMENGVILPLCKMRMKFYLKEKFEGLKIDDYGRPVFWGVRISSPL